MKTVLTWQPLKKMSLGPQSSEKYTLRTTVVEAYTWKWNCKIEGYVYVQLQK
jgi:hypothetical protein